MKISIVMATYNGGKYIEEQLHSIYNQTRKADEIIFCDDGSSDNTIEVIEKFIQERNLSETWIIQKGSHQGVTKNFYSGVDLTRGDIVLFSDQDDVWDLKKIELITKPFKNPNVLSVTCRKSLINQNGKEIKSYPDFVLYPHFVNNKGRFLSLAEECCYQICSGLCLAFRKSIFFEVKDFVLKNNLEYDLPFGLVTAIYGGNYTIKEKLVLHRIHENNVSSPINTITGRKQQYSHQEESHFNKCKMLEAVLNHYSLNLSNNEISLINKAINIHKRSIHSLKNKNKFRLLFLLFLSNKYINKYQFIADFISCL